jgi:hypothetical protein
MNRFSALISNILNEDDKKSRITAFKKLHKPAPLFKFNYVSWDWKEKQPTDELDYFYSREDLPFAHETSLGSDAYFVFFSDIKLTDRGCGILAMVPAYIDELFEAGKVIYDEKEKVYNCFVDVASIAWTVEPF